MITDSFLLSILVYLFVRTHSTLPDAKGDFQVLPAPDIHAHVIAAHVKKVFLPKAKNSEGQTCNSKQMHKLPDAFVSPCPWRTSHRPLLEIAAENQFERNAGRGTEFRQSFE